MTETEPMSVNERRKYLHKMRIRCWQAESKGAKSALLDEMQSVTTLHRKSVIRLITGDLARQPQVRLRPDTLDRLCHTKKLTPLKQAQLQPLRRTINPLRLRKNIQDLIDQIFALPCADAQGNAENVYPTLLPQEPAIPR